MFLLPCCVIIHSTVRFFFDVHFLGDARGRSNSSSDGTPDRWDDALEARSPEGCRRPVGSSSRHADPEDDEEKEDGLGCAGSRSRPMTRKFFVGQWLDVKDTVNNWLEATVMDMTDSGERSGE